jgi:ketosteroid isomerase-like protein
VTKSLEERLEHLESREAIRDLVARYADAVDANDYQALGDLFVLDVRSPVPTASGKVEVVVGRAALRDWYASAPSMDRPHLHFIGNHVIAFEDADNARGTVYCRAAHETERPGFWRLSTLKYRDRYRRDDGQWLFVSRKPSGWYAVEYAVEPPGELMAGLERKPG